MPVRNNGGCRRFHAGQQPASPAPQQIREPEMRHWSHPTPAAASADSLSAQLYDLRCALSCQTQLLTEICTLLKQSADNAQKNP